METQSLEQVTVNSTGTLKRRLRGQEHLLFQRILVLFPVPILWLTIISNLVSDAQLSTGSQLTYMRCLHAGIHPYIGIFLKQYPKWAKIYKLVEKNILFVHRQCNLEWHLPHISLRLIKKLRKVYDRWQDTEQKNPFTGVTKGHWKPQIFTSWFITLMKLQSWSSNENNLLVVGQHNMKNCIKEWQHWEGREPLL